MPLTPAERSLRSKMASHLSWAQTDDRTARTAPARAGFMARFEREVDPEGVLPPAERARRAEQLMRAHMAKLSLAASKAKRQKMARG
jgi:hypothetical protein